MRGIWLQKRLQKWHQEKRHFSLVSKRWWDAWEMDTSEPAHRLRTVEVLANVLFTFYRKWLNCWEQERHLKHTKSQLVDQCLKKDTVRSIFHIVPSFMSSPAPSDWASAVTASSSATRGRTAWFTDRTVWIREQFNVAYCGRTGCKTVIGLSRAKGI